MAGAVLAGLVVVALIVGVAGSLGGWFDDSTADAQEREIEGAGDAATVRITDDENAARIDRAVFALFFIAGGLTVLTVLFWWHTQPRRRARALAGREPAEAEPATADRSEERVLDGQPG